MTRTQLHSALFAISTMALALAMNGAAQAADPTPKWCSGVKIVAINGGWNSPGDSYSQVVANGFRQAEADLGPTVTYNFLNWDPNLALTSLRDAIKDKADGIVFVGFANEEATRPLIDKAFAQGTIVTMATHPLPEAQKQYVSQGMGYVGAETQSAGFALGTETARRAGIKAGDSVFVWGFARSSHTQGVIAAMDKVGAKVIFKEVNPAVISGYATASEQLADVLQADPGVKAVVTEHWYLTSVVGTNAMLTNLNPGQVYFAGVDVDFPESVQSMKDGYLNLAQDQQPYLQGYLPILNICLTKKFGFAGLNVDTSGAFIDPTNVDAVAPLVEKQIR
ncbi:MAG: substrate-binding domain-containing protein [Roseiarcus sp.]